MLWKHRDTSQEANFVERSAATDSTFAYVALYNAGDSTLAEAWTGMNSRGFAIMNTASYNLAHTTTARASLCRLRYSAVQPSTISSACCPT